MTNLKKLSDFPPDAELSGNERLAALSPKPGGGNSNTLISVDALLTFIASSIGAGTAGTYVHVAYAETDTGNGFSTTPTATSTHISFVTTALAAAPAQSAFTTWARFKGDPGIDAEGTAGQSAFVHIRYAEDGSGTGISTTPTVTTTYIGIVSSTSPDAPPAGEFPWVPYVAPSAPVGPLPALYVKLSEVSGGTFNLSMNANRAHVIERDAAKTVALTDTTSDAGRADVTFVVPKTGTIYPVTLSPAQSSLTFSGKRGYADNYLFKSFHGKVYIKPALLDFPYDPVTSYWIDGGGVAYVFEQSNNPLNNRIANADHLTTNSGTVRTPYGLEETGGQLAFSDDFTSINFNQPFMVHWVVSNFPAAADGTRVLGLSSRTNSASYITLNHDAVGKRISVTVRDSTINTWLGTGPARLDLPKDGGGNTITGLISLLLSRDSAGRFNLRCLNTGESLKQSGVSNPDGYYPDDSSAKVLASPTLGATFGGIKRTSSSSTLNTGTCSPRYFRAIQEGYTAARAKASHNIASDWIAAVDPTGPQLAKLP